MSTQDGPLRIDIYVGAGEPRSMDLTPGQVLGPLSIGTAGSWKIQAQNVQPVHGYIYSDGTNLFLRSESGATPIIASGEIVPADQWLPVRPPCEIKVGVARLWFGTPSAQGVDAAATTRLDSLGPQQPAQSPSPAVEPETSKLRPVAEVPRSSAPEPRSSAPEPRSSAPEPRSSAPEPRSPLGPQEAAGRQKPPGSPVAPPPDEQGATRSIPIEELLAQQAQKRLLAQQPGDANPVGMGHSPSGPGLPPLPGPGGAPVLSFGVPPSNFGAPPGFPSMLTGPGGASSSAPSGSGAPPGLLMRPPPQPDVAGSPRTPAAGPGGASKLDWVKTQGLHWVKTQGLDWVKAQWKEASGPKRILAILMLPLLAAVWIIFTDSPPPPKRPAKPAVSIATQASATTSAMPAASGSGALPADAKDGGTADNDAGSQTAGDPPAATEPTGSASASSAPPVASDAALAGGKKTAQRQAVDAVAAGSYEEAAKLYEELAKTHPEVPAYAEAARIMRAKASKSK